MIQAEQVPTSKPFYVSKRVYGMAVLGIMVLAKALNWFPDNIWAQRIQELLLYGSGLWAGYFGIKDNIKIDFKSVFVGEAPDEQPPA